jgi:hypothetical protein
MSKNMEKKTHKINEIILRVIEIAREWMKLVVTTFIIYSLFKL